jgi:hypothetical protein
VSSTQEPSADLLAVVRWQASGGEVEIVEPGPPVVIALRTCDGGQEMQRIVSRAPDLLAHLSTQRDQVPPL